MWQLVGWTSQKLTWWSSVLHQRSDMLPAISRLCVLDLCSLGQAILFKLVLRILIGAVQQISLKRTLWLLSGCGVLHPSIRTYRPSWQDWNLHLLLPEERGGPAPLRRKQSGVCPSGSCRTPGVEFSEVTDVFLQGITFRRVGVPTANDIIKSSSKDAVRYRF